MAKHVGEPHVVQTDLDRYVRAHDFQCATDSWPLFASRVHSNADVLGNIRIASHVLSFELGNVRALTPSMLLGRGNCSYFVVKQEIK